MEQLKLSPTSNLKLAHESLNSKLEQAHKQVSIIDEQLSAIMSRNETPEKISGSTISEQPKTIIDHLVVATNSLDGLLIRLEKVEKHLNQLI